MNCKEMSDSYGMATDVIREQNKNCAKLFLIICILSIALCLESFYILYDRKLDAEYEVTATEVIQDGEGYNSYIGETGVIYNGTESEENNE